MARPTQTPSRHSPYATSSAKEATDIVLAARKTWKLMSSKRERVWPPSIEAALIEALQKYRPESVTDIQLLQRFPKRNCWISKYIKRRTGHDRSAKQVGSRLQQLRDSCRDARILKLLSRRQYDDDDGYLDLRGATPLSESASPCSASPSSSSVFTSSPVGGASSENCSNGVSAPEVKLLHTLVRIELTSPPYSRSKISFDTTASEREFRPTLVCVDLKLVSSVTTLFSWKEPTLSVHWARFLDVAEHHCLFKVFIDGRVVHLERTPILLQSEIAQNWNGTNRQMYLYETTFLPEYWIECFSSIDMASCEVHQCFIRRRSTCEDDPDFLSLKELPEDEVLHTVQYTFVDLRLSAPSTSSVEPTELWTSPMEEASTKPPSTGSVSRASDALGLDAPVVLSKAELVGDGRAHFPVEEESYFDSRGFYILPSSPSVSRCSSNGMTGSPIQSTCGIYDASKNTMYKSDFRSPSSASVNNMPSSTCTSTYSITASTPQYNYLTTFSPTEWMEHQAYHQQQLAVLSSPDDKRYAYFWEQPTSHDQSCYSGYVTPMNYTPMIPETQEPEPQNLYVYAQPEYMTTSPVPAYSDNLCQRQHDHQMCDTYIYENLIDFPGCSSLKSKIAYASEPTLTSSNLSPQLSYCAIEDGYQMCSPAQICD